MSKSLMWKLAAIGGLIILLLIPLGMVNGLVSDRQHYRQQAIASIADGTAGSQTLAGPVWVLPYKQLMLEPIDGKPDQHREVWRDRTTALLPDKLSVAGQLKTETRQRGIYRTQVYSTELAVTGHFQLPIRAGLAADTQIQWGQPYLSVGIADVRGIKTSPRINWGSSTLDFAPGARLKALGGGIHANLAAYDGAAASIPFSFKLSLNGMDDLNVVPLGRDTEVSLQSDWRHPSFSGRFSPEDRAVSDKGFTARWRTSWFSTNLSEHFEQCATSSQCEPFQNARLGVRLIEPVDAYLQTDRAVKYGFLFVFLTFCTFFLTEVLKRIAIHPVQYALVGLSLAVFFLLLLSFSEQWAFGPAYLLAALACVTQNAFYASHALGSRWRGLGFAGLLSALYGLLYVLLRSEDHALLLGSLLLFGLLTTVMVLTRKLNWYDLASPPKSQNEETV
ncbi:cell envelope integrity protein CreD [Chitinimonas sp. BJB300]|uniref:cell envelope integrity protein CreD n=1 Tax=Chitinimonas sp. BJB300 TaxID=1559339 RepID=UPI000C0D09BA|nr:cell envelope integrity protein CreD [Chitinimonas sp. BJB300]PHV10364.1 cell envelope integrity protein CreD [Chitinimonas sp. BJB300]TSJ91040.1 cell envelope integrity protein CreD [Chitinimonas sp. BJB300]